MADWRTALVGAGVALGGVLVGASLFRSEPAVAQGPGYTKCIIARQESLDTNNSSQIERPGRNRIVEIPSGWEPIGGGGGVSDEGDRDGFVVLCRR